MDPTWPGGKAVAAFFSFDLDGESWLLAVDRRNADLPITMSQAAYGPKVGRDGRLGRAIVPARPAVGETGHRFEHASSIEAPSILHKCRPQQSCGHILCTIALSFIRM